MKDVINDGPTVFCDGCNVDGDEVDEQGEAVHKGGGLVGSYAYCRECLSVAGTPDEKWSDEKSFGDNVREYRLRVYGNADNVTIIWTGKDAAEWLKG